MEINKNPETILPIAEESGITIGYTSRIAWIGAGMTALGLLVVNIILLKVYLATHQTNIMVVILVLDAMCWYFPFAYLLLPYRLEFGGHGQIISYSLLTGKRFYQLDSVIGIERNSSRLARLTHYGHVTLIFPNDYLRIPFVLGGIYGVDKKIETTASRTLDECLKRELPSLCDRFDRSQVLKRNMILVLLGLTVLVIIATWG